MWCRKITEPAVFFYILRAKGVEGLKSGGEAGDFLC